MKETATDATGAVADTAKQAGTTVTEQAADSASSAKGPASSAASSTDSDATRSLYVDPEPTQALVDVAPYPPATSPAPNATPRTSTPGTGLPPL